MKSLNYLISNYTYSLQQGELQVAYKGILDFIGKLRADFIKKYPYYDTGSVYQGYMDMTYFSVSTKFLKDKGLKVAIVYIHKKGYFEVWLSGRNREISRQHESLAKRITSDDIAVFHDDNNQDAIVECVLTFTPDFEDQASLIDIIEQHAEKFISIISSLL